MSGQSETDVRTVLNLAYKKLEFVSDDQIPFEFYRKSVQYVRGIDMDDLVFVALTEYLDELLWTGDQQLIKGLRSRGFQKVVDFTEVKEIVLTKK
nr:PIN domain-containing protein [Lewinella sp. W8]